MSSRYRWTLTDLADPGNPEVLTLDPIGWDELACKLSRHTTYHGVFVDFTLGLKFHCNGGGKQFIDTVYQEQDIQGIIELLIEFDCDSSGTYAELYTGRLNLASYKTDGEYTTVNIERSELYSKLISRDTINVDLETDTSIGDEAITTIDPVLVPTPSMDIKYENEWRIRDGYSIELLETFTAAGASGVGITDALITHRMPVIKDDFDTTKPGIEFDEYGDQPSDSKPFEKSYIQSLFDFDGTLDGVAVDVPITVNWEADLSGTYDIQQTSTGAHHLRVQFQLKLVKGSRNNPTLIQNFFDGGFGVQDMDEDNITWNSGGVQSGTFTLIPGESVWLFWRFRLETGFGGNIFNSQAPTVRVQWDYNESYFKFNSVTSFEDGETVTRAMPIHEAFTMVCDAIGDTNNTFRSDYYGRTDSEKRTYASDGCGSLRVITNGLNIREFDRPIFCTLKDLFDSATAIDNIGLGIENDTTIRVEKIEHFYSNAQVLNLTNPIKVDVVNDNSRYPNNIEIGYFKWDTEFKGGLQEPNAKHEYSTEVNSVKNEYKRLSKYLASAYAIELTRRKNIDRFPDEDFRYDNDNFFIQVIRSGYFPFEPELFADAFTGGSGMDSLSTAYNLRLTPSRMLLAHFNAIAAGLQTINGQIKFVRGDGNTNLNTTATDNGCQEEYNGQPLAENQSFDWDDSDVANVTPLWGTERYSFEYPLTASQLNTLRANPHGYIQFLDDHGNTRKGFILNVDFKMKTGLTKFDLIKKFE